MDHIAFYRFVALTDLPRIQADVLALAEGLQGSVLLAAEGINGMLAGAPGAIDAFMEGLCAPAFHGGVFAGMVFKRTPSPVRAFGRLKVRIRPEIVPLGIAGVDGADTGTDVPPAAWRALLDRDDVVVIDNRNRFEVSYGRFRNAIDPGVDNFREFPDWVRTQLPRWQAEGKTIAMYCTGGIRCEKTSAWMKQALGVPVLQLQGGILNYFQQMPDAGRDFEGTCFVFDERETLAPGQSQENSAPSPALPR